MNRRFVLCAFAVVIAAPAYAGAASLSITEIMYDAPGLDADGEWVEVRNDGVVPVDLSLNDFRLNDGSAHKITAVRGDALLPGAYAVIAASSSGFLAAYPSYAGTLYRSAFSLGNKGDTVSVTESGMTLDSVPYLPDTDADGTGYSLQRGSDAWVAALATPGAGYGAASPPPPIDDEPETASTPPAGDVADPLPPAILASAGPDRVVIAGATTEFSGAARIGGEVAPESTRFLWNFGDGVTFLGRSTVHVFRSPGRYVVSLSVSTGDESATDLAIVEVVPSPVAIASVFPGPLGYIAVANESASAVDVSLWYLEDGARTFVLPPGTYLAGKSTVQFASSVTGLAPVDAASVMLKFPSGIRVPDRTTAVAARGAPVAPIVSSVPSVVVADRPSSVPVRAATPRVLGSATAPVSAMEASAPDQPVPQSAVPEIETGTGGTWYFALALLLAVGAGAALLVERRQPVDEYEIVE